MPSEEFSLNSETAFMMCLMSVVVRMKIELSSSLSQL